MASLLLCLGARLLDVRGRVYELLTHCIPPDVIIKVRVLMLCIGVNVSVIVDASVHDSVVSTGVTTDEDAALHTCHIAGLAQGAGCQL